MDLWIRCGSTSGFGQRACLRRGARRPGPYWGAGTRERRARKALEGDSQGDTIEVTIMTFRRTLVVTGVAERRGPASDSLTLYAETPESLVARELNAAERRLSRPLGADLGTRPTKARQRLDALRRGQRGHAESRRHRDQELQASREPARAVPALVVEEFPSAWAQEWKDVLEVRRSSPCSGELRVTGTTDGRPETNRAPEGLSEAPTRGTWGAA